ncbi:hypothetical protein CEJ87_01950 [Caldifermentibacillus hisashii]|nr:hypothetical protein CEJ87_01950 [Caldifermentibacillus hisashii]
MFHFLYYICTVISYGMKTSLLPLNKNPRFIFVTPSHQFPLGGTLPIQFIVHLKQILQLYYFISILPMKL